MKIRTATKRDWPEILQLIKKHPRTLMQKHLPRPSTFFVALESQKIIGCCALEIYSKRLAEVRTLAVAEKFQGQGVGTALIEACLKKARKKKVYEVLTITGAVSLFEKKGFDTFHNEKYALLKVLG